MNHLFFIPYFVSSTVSGNSGKSFLTVASFSLQVTAVDLCINGEEKLVVSGTKDGKDTNNFHCQYALVADKVSYTTTLKTLLLPDLFVNYSVSFARNHFSRKDFLR